MGRLLLIVTSSPNFIIFHLSIPHPTATDRNKRRRRLYRLLSSPGPDIWTNSVDQCGQAPRIRFGPSKDILSSGPPWQLPSVLHRHSLTSSRLAAPHPSVCIRSWKVSSPLLISTSQSTSSIPIIKARSFPLAPFQDTSYTLSVPITACTSTFSYEITGVHSRSKYKEFQL